MRQSREAIVTLRWSRLWLPCLLVGILSYMVYHGVQGERGILAYQRNALTVEGLQRQHAQLRTHRQHLEARLQRLYPQQLDADLLSEYVQRTLGLYDPDGVLVLPAEPTP